MYIDSEDKLGYSRDGKMYFYDYLIATLISKFINIYSTCLGTISLSNSDKYTLFDYN